MVIFKFHVLLFVLFFKVLYVVILQPEMHICLTSKWLQKPHKWSFEQVYIPLSQKRGKSNTGRCPW